MGARPLPMNEAISAYLIQPDWPAPANVQAIQTTRVGGVGAGQYDSLNLGDHVNDDPIHVAKNRQLLSDVVPTEPVWLKQVHGTRVIDAARSGCIEQADASFTTQKNVVCVTLTADCLPILLCDQAGTVVASVHAGWRSLCDGVIEQTVAAMGVDKHMLLAWLGPAIGPSAFEVGAVVRDAFVRCDQQAEKAFRRHGDKWLGDLYSIAKQRLNTLGVTDIYGEVMCTYSNPDRFFSYRRDGDTGRMASMVWIAA